MDFFKDLWTEVQAERRQIIETGVEKMLQDGKQGLLIVENLYGVILSADLSEKVPYGQILLMREELYANGSVPPPTEGG